MTDQLDTKAIRAQMEAPELLPCPFCGGNAHLVSEHDVDTNGRFYFVKCSSCRAKGQESFANETCPIFFEQVRCAWNRRTPNLAEQVNTLTTEKHADAEAIGALEAKLAEVMAERDADRAKGFQAGIEAAANACVDNTWRHEGEDAYSRGLDRGALEQASACAAVIRALSPTPQPSRRRKENKS